MRSGKFDRRITIQRNEPTTSGSGAQRENWVDLATVWARWQPARSDERFAAQQTIGFGLGTFTVRWSRMASEVGVKHRILFDARFYDIRDVRSLGRREGIEIDARCRSENPVGPGSSLDFSKSGNSQNIPIINP